MAKPELGAKRQCQNCGTKFFDLNRDPITCPKCGTVFQAMPIARGAAARSPVVTRDDADTDSEAELQGAELVSLEDAEAGEKPEAAAEEEDIEVEDVATDDTFLEEEEEESDDVSGLIDGDIETDEEG